MKPKLDDDWYPDNFDWYVKWAATVCILISIIARAGGIDGRGGFPAILHPNETVVDHNKGQGIGATVNFNISTVDAAGFDQLLASRKGLITSIINNAMNNQGKMGVV